MRWRLPLLLLGALAAVLAWAWPQDLEPWRTLGLLSGWAGTTLLVASLLLLLRLPGAVRALGGLQALQQAHHHCGVLAYALLLLHPLALAAGGGGWSLLDPRPHGPAVWLGWLALLGLMAGLAATFALRLPYRRWHAWHHLTGAAVVAGLAHVALLLADPPLLWTLALVAALALGLRYTWVDRGALARPYRVQAVHSVAPQVVEATLLPLAAALQARPGQFVLLALGAGPGFAGCGEFHPFTVTQAQGDGTLAVAIKALGPCSTHAQQLTAGTAVRVEGPFGTVFDRPAQLPQLWVAGGIGITPFIAALRDGPLTQPTALLLLAADAASAPFAAELQHHAGQQPLLQLLVRSSRDAALDLPPLLDAVPDLAQREVRACGPDALVQVLRTQLAGRGVPPQRVHADRFDFR